VLEDGAGGSGVNRTIDYGADAASVVEGGCFSGTTKRRLLKSNNSNKVWLKKDKRMVEVKCSRRHAAKLLKIWGSLEVGYRIPRMKRDPNAIAAADRAEREERRRARSRSKSKSRSVSPEPNRAPSGPRSGVPQRFAPQRPPFRRPFTGPLPSGWFSAQSNGQTYYYSASGSTTWQRPTQPASQPPPPPKVVSNEQKLQDIINSITKGTTTKDSPASTPGPQKTEDSVLPERKERKEKWRSYSEEKRKKLYENTVSFMTIWVCIVNDANITISSFRTSNMSWISSKADYPRRT